MFTRLLIRLSLVLLASILLIGSGIATWLTTGARQPILAASVPVVPARVSAALTPLGDIKQVASGYFHTCALTTAGGVQCWGYNSSGQLGDGSTTDRRTPVVAGGNSGIHAITTGDYHTCALTAVRGVQCWGNNGFGQLGDGSTTRRLTPVTVAGLSSGIQSITGGFLHTCALTTVGGVQCWGDNASGQLGDSSTTRRLTPVMVAGLSSGAQAITAGTNHTCALTTAGGVQCWGDNTSGQLGDGSTTDRLTPVAVAGLSSGVQAIAAGYLHTCALTTVGGVQCWGANWDGQLGDGSTTDRLTPVVVAGLSSGAQSITAGWNHTCALTTDGGVQCWGNNRNGQLGDGSTTRRLTPVTVAGLSSDVQAITAGDYHTCALTTDGGVQCWGDNWGGQLGNGTLDNSTIPVAVMVDSATATPTPTNTVVPPTATGTATPTATATNTPVPPTATLTNLVGGAVNYRTTTRPMSGLTLDLSGASTAGTTTNASGLYSFTLQTTGAHTVTPGLIGQINGISAFDAAYVAQCVAAVRNLADCPMLAADASGNNALSAFDAAQIAQYAAGVAGPTSRVGRWVFSPATRAYASLTSDLLSENYAAYLVGEVSGNWQPPAATAAQQTASEQTAAPLTVATAADGTVTLGHTGTVSDLLAYQITLHYDASAGRLTEVIPAAAVSADAGWELVVNEATPGVVELVGYGVTPVNGRTALVSLHFQDGAGQATTLAPTVAAAQLNEVLLWFNQEVGYHYFLPLIGAK